MGERGTLFWLFLTECDLSDLQIYVNSRGRELPGNYNHILLSELFQVQSSRWPQIAEEHLSNIYDKLVGFVKQSLSHITKDERILAELLEITEIPLQTSRQNAEEELRKLCGDERQQPITYNHYYNDNVQKTRLDSIQNMINNAMNQANANEWNGRLHISNNNVDAERLLASLQKRVVVDMDKQACAEALAGLSAYYKVKFGHALLQSMIDGRRSR